MTSSTPSQAEELRNTVPVHYLPFHPSGPRRLPFQNLQQLHVADIMTIVCAVNRHQYEQRLPRPVVRDLTALVTTSPLLRRFFRDAFWWLFLAHFADIDLELLLNVAKQNVLLSSADAAQMSLEAIRKRTAAMAPKMPPVGGGGGATGRKGQANTTSTSTALSPRQQQQQQPPAAFSGSQRSKSITSLIAAGSPSPRGGGGRSPSVAHLGGTEGKVNAMFYGGGGTKQSNAAPSPSSPFFHAADAAAAAGVTIGGAAGAKDSEQDKFRQRMVSLHHDTLARLDAAAAAAAAAAANANKDGSLNTSTQSAPSRGNPPPSSAAPAAAAMRAATERTRTAAGGVSMAPIPSHLSLRAANRSTEQLAHVASPTMGDARQLAEIIRGDAADDADRSRTAVRGPSPHVHSVHVHRSPAPPATPPIGTHPSSRGRGANAHGGAVQSPSAASLRLGSPRVPSSPNSPKGQGGGVVSGGTRSPMSPNKQRRFVTAMQRQRMKSVTGHSDTDTESDSEEGEGGATASPSWGSGTRFGANITLAASKEGPAGTSDAKRVSVSILKPLSPSALLSGSGSDPSGGGSQQRQRSPSTQLRFLFNASSGGNASVDAERQTTKGDGTGNNSTGVALSHLDAFAGGGSVLNAVRREKEERRRAKQQRQRNAKNESSADQLRAFSSSSSSSSSGSSSTSSGGSDAYAKGHSTSTSMRTMSAGEALEEAMTIRRFRATRALAEDTDDEGYGNADGCGDYGNDGGGAPHSSANRNSVSTDAGGDGNQRYGGGLFTGAGAVDTVAVDIAEADMARRRWQRLEGRRRAAAEAEAAEEAIVMSETVGANPLLTPPTAANSAAAASPASSSSHKSGNRPSLVVPSRATMAHRALLQLSSRSAVRGVNVAAMTPTKGGGGIGIGPNASAASSAEAAARRREAFVQAEHHKLFSRMAMLYGQLLLDLMHSQGAGGGLGGLGRARSPPTAATTPRRGGPYPSPTTTGDDAQQRRRSPPRKDATPLTSGRAQREAAMALASASSASPLLVSPSHHRANALLGRFESTVHRDALVGYLPDLLAQGLCMAFALALPFAAGTLLDADFQLSVLRHVSFWIHGVESTQRFVVGATIQISQQVLPPTPAPAPPDNGRLPPPPPPPPPSAPPQSSSATTPASAPLPINSPTAAAGAATILTTVALPNVNSISAAQRHLANPTLAAQDARSFRASASVAGWPVNAVLTVISRRRKEFWLLVKEGKAHPVTDYMPSTLESLRLVLRTARLTGGGALVRAEDTKRRKEQLAKRQRRRQRVREELQRLLSTNGGGSGGGGPNGIDGLLSSASSGPNSPAAAALALLLPTSASGATPMIGGGLASPRSGSSRTGGPRGSLSSPAPQQLQSSPSAVVGGGGEGQDNSGDIVLPRLPPKRASFGDSVGGTSAPQSRATSAGRRRGGGGAAPVISAQLINQLLMQQAAGGGMGMGMGGGASAAATRADIVDRQVAAFSREMRRVHTTHTFASLNALATGGAAEADTPAPASGGGRDKNAVGASGRGMDAFLDTLAKQQRRESQSARQQQQQQGQGQQGGQQNSRFGLAQPAGGRHAQMAASAQLLAENGIDVSGRISSVRNVHTIKKELDERHQPAAPWYMRPDARIRKRTGALYYLSGGGSASAGAGGGGPAGSGPEEEGDEEAAAVRQRNERDMQVLSANPAAAAPATARFTLTNWSPLIQRYMLLLGGKNSATPESMAWTLTAQN